MCHLHPRHCEISPQTLKHPELPYAHQMELLEIDQWE